MKLISSENMESQIKMRVVAVMVTYNRKELLLRSLRAVLNQKIMPDCVIVVDNASTDGTERHLTESGILANSLVTYVRRDRNDGGAAGFHFGMAAALQWLNDKQLPQIQSDDWLWVMDDDCLASEDSLMQLARVRALSERVGFICSHVQWQDGAPHRMNLPLITNLVGGLPFNRFIESGALAVQSCSFVSVIVSVAAVRECGLPLAQLFIWGDDVEYFSRLTRNGWLGLYVPASKVMHLTAKNANDDLTVASKAEMWKHFYGIRNQLVFMRSQQGWMRYISAVFKRLFWVNYRLCTRAQHKKSAVWHNTKGTLASLIFYPRQSN